MVGGSTRIPQIQEMVTKYFSGKTLNKSVRGKAKQYDRMINVLWHCYLISDSGTQLEVPPITVPPVTNPDGQ